MILYNCANSYLLTTKKIKDTWQKSEKSSSSNIFTEVAVHSLLILLLVTETLFCIVEKYIFLVYKETHSHLLINLPFFYVCEDY
jgi:type III secretory pathway component EscU